jgi:hypothetical protein
MVVSKETLIYIRVTGQKAECWAPAGGLRISDNIYRVTSIVGDDSLEFGIGDLVRCENRCFPDGSEATVAIAPAGPS